ncbi:MAG: hypothetical protein DMD77_13750 [Candidatus Rokuibacteriota bacterium]|nr:MAG: hypothetical protein DMD77_13750 [Candidatus Rokubacteria bacterium]
MRGKTRPVDLRCCCLAARSSSARASAARAWLSESASTTMTRSFGPALSASAVRSPDWRRRSWLAGVPMRAATSLTPAAVRRSRARVKRATES